MGTKRSNLKQLRCAATAVAMVREFYMLQDHGSCSLFPLS